jgi:hypothetical protein
MVAIVSMVVEETYYTFSDFDGAPGYLIIVMRLFMWLWFILSIFFNFEEKIGPVSEFVTHLMIMGSVYILSMPTVIAFSWLFTDYFRNKLVVAGSILI